MIHASCERFLSTVSGVEVWHEQSNCMHLYLSQPPDFKLTRYQMRFVVVMRPASGYIGHRMRW